MRTHMIVALFALTSFGAFAQGRPSTYNLTCAEAQNLVSSEGAVVMNYDYHEKAGHLYHRFVAHAGHCDSGEDTRAFWVRSTDTESCPLFICDPHSRN